MKVLSIRLFSLVGISSYLLGMMLTLPVQAQKMGNKGEAADLMTQSKLTRVTGVLPI